MLPVTYLLFRWIAAVVLVLVALHMPAPGASLRIPVESEAHLSAAVWRRRMCVLLVITLGILSAFLAVRQMSHSLWFDEIQTADIVRAPTLTGLVEKALHKRPYPPLYFLFDRISWKLRGDELGVRFPSAVFGALATLAVYLLGVSFFRARTALAAALLFCLTVGMFRYFVDANPYTLLALTSTVSVWTLWRALHSDRAEDWIMYIAAAAGGLACHSLFVFHIGSHLLAGLTWKRSLRWSLQPRFYKAIALVFLLWFSWVVFYRLNGGLQRPIVLRRLFDGHMSYVFAATYAGFLSRGGPIVLFTWPVLQAAGMVTLFLRDKRLFAFLTSVIVVPLIGISLFTHATLDFVAYRYGSGIFPLTCLLAACVLEASRRSLAKVVLCGVLSVNLAAEASVIAAAPVGFFDFQDWKGVSAFLTQNATPGDTLLLAPGWTREALDYYDHSRLARENMGDDAALAPALLKYCGVHSSGRKWFIVSLKALESAQSGVGLAKRLEESGRVSVSPPRRFTGIWVYPLSCQP